VKAANEGNTRAAGHTARAGKKKNSKRRKGKLAKASHPTKHRDSLDRQREEKGRGISRGQP